MQIKEENQDQLIVGLFKTFYKFRKIQMCEMTAIKLYVNFMGSIKTGQDV